MNSMQLSRSYHARLADEKKLKHLAAIRPEWRLAEDPAQFTPPYLEKIGIEYSPEVVGNGFLKLYWADFIVEELTHDGRIATVSPQDDPVEEPITVKRPKAAAVLVKQGQDTFDAIQRLAEALGVNPEQISYSGLKDGRALTAQEIAVNHPDITPDALQTVHIPNLFLKNIRWRNMLLDQGRLYGNRFTILVRSPEVEPDKLQLHLDVLSREGFINFYSLQRFGTRLINTQIGRLIMLRNYEEAAKLFLGGDSPHEMTVMRELRREALGNWKDWETMIQIYYHLPYHFYNELKFLLVLREHSRDYGGAFAAIPQHTRLLTYSYANHYANRLLSLLKIQNRLPEEIPVLNPAPEVIDLYRQVIPESELQSLAFYHEALPFLQLKDHRSIKSTLTLTVHAVIPVDQGYVFHFDLQKGAYATTFLSQLFHLYQGQPVPEWVNTAPCDTRAIFGHPSLAETEERFPLNPDPENDGGDSLEG
jgi:TruD family tRNA pseudouridine synthase